MASRDGILNATLEADRIHSKFDTQSRAERGEGRIDVFGMLVDRDIPVMFRPLKGLLGAFVDDPDRGVILTTQRQLRVQRFTAAHELGHIALEHEASLDGDEILSGAIFTDASGYDSREAEANAFASQLLTPQWLIVLHMKQQGWSRDDFTDPAIVYQLALRLGSSYQATCYSLAEKGAINGTTRDKLLNVSRKSIKQALVGSYSPANWYGDVWLVTERDNGMILEGSRSDLVVLRFEEHASSGYVWQFGELADTGLNIVEDGRASSGGQSHFGGVVFRTVIAEAQYEYGARGHVRLSESRPWEVQGETLHSMELDVEFSGPVRAGLLAAQREALLSIA